MKKFIAVLSAAFLTLLLFSCSTVEVTDTDDTTALQDSDVNKEIIVSEAVSILEKGGIDSGASGSHGGQQTRICRTDHGTYAAFVSYQDDNKYYFYIVKTDGSDNVTVLYEDWCPADAALVNIAQDNNGDVYVTAFPVDTTQSARPQYSWLAMYVISAETDQVTEIEAKLRFNDTCSGGYGYAMPMFDFENRRIYAIYSGVGDPGKLSWFTYNINTGSWQDECITTVLEDMTHTYFYCFPDGNGGAFVVGERDISVDMMPELKFDSGSPVYASFLWDKLDLFIIPDMTKGDCRMVSIEDADYSRADEGIAPINQNNQNGDVFIDSNGLMHVIYISYLADYDLAGGGETTSAKHGEIRHAIYSDGVCIYNEKMKLQNEDLYYYIRMAENSDGELFLITFPINSEEYFEIYKAADGRGEEWTLVKNEKMNWSEDFYVSSFSISCPRNNSLYDGTVDCLVFGYYYNGTVYGTDLYKFSVTLD
ncbi:MAG: hypothetical protein IKV54_08650 [Clostridia bacterium]|nr:hypothetical protein [Clostridia bacterium]